MIRLPLAEVKQVSENVDHNKEGLKLLLPAPQSKRSRSNEFVWLLDYEPAPCDQVILEPILGIHLGLSFLDWVQVEQLNEFMISVSQAVTSCSPVCHALADIGKVTTTGRGGLYHGRVPLYVPYDRLIARRGWIQGGPNRMRKLRGVYWGQLLSEWMVGRLGGATRFIREYRKLDDAVNTELAQVFPDGSLLVRLSNSPSDLRSPNPVADPLQVGITPPLLDRGAWLHQRFVKAGIL